jgi:secondary thiamine-phosphate synthase enzyme
MAVFSTNIELKTRGNTDMMDLTPEVTQAVAQSNLQNGMGCVFVPGSTCGITTIEFESGCLADLRRFFDEVAPENREYVHHLRWGDGNGHSHLRSALIGPSLSFPFQNGKPILGTWQQILLIDFDNRPRSRSIVLQLVGE